MAFTCVVFVVFLLGFEVGSGFRIEINKSELPNVQLTRIALEPDSGVQHYISKEGVSTQTSLVDRNEDQKIAEKTDGSKSGRWMASLIEYACSWMTRPLGPKRFSCDWMIPECCMPRQQHVEEEFVETTPRSSPGLRMDKVPLHYSEDGLHSPRPVYTPGANLPLEPRSQLPFDIDSPKAVVDGRRGFPREETGPLLTPRSAIDGGGRWEVPTQQEQYRADGRDEYGGYPYEHHLDHFKGPEPESPLQEVQLPLPVPLDTPRHVEGDHDYVEAPTTPLSGEASQGQTAQERADILTRELAALRMQMLVLKKKDLKGYASQDVAKNAHQERDARLASMEAKEREILALLRQMEADSPLADRKGLKLMPVKIGDHPKAQQMLSSTPKSSPGRPALMLPRGAVEERSYNSSPRTPQTPQQDQDYTPVSRQGYSPWGSDADSTFSETPRSQAPSNLSGTPRSQDGQWPMHDWEVQSSTPSEPWEGSSAPSTPKGRQTAREYVKRFANAVYPSRLAAALSSPAKWRRNANVTQPSARQEPTQVARAFSGLTPRSAGDAEILNGILRQISRDDQWKMPQDTEAAQKEANRLVKVLEDMEIALWILELEEAEDIAAARAAERQAEFAWCEEWQQNTLAKLAQIYKERPKVEVHLWVYLGCFQINSDEIFPPDANRVYVDADRHRDPPLKACKKLARDAGSTWFVMERRQQISAGGKERLACAHASNVRLQKVRKITPLWPEEYYGSSCHAKDPCGGEDGPKRIGYMKVWAKAYKEQEVFQDGKIAKAIQQRTTGPATRKARTLLGQAPNGPWHKVKAK